MIRLTPEAIFARGRPSDVAGHSIRGTSVTFAAQGARFALQVAGTVVLARLLTPDDYGIVAMALVVVGFAQVFRDAGLSTATVQREHLTRSQVDLLIWVNLVVSVGVGALVLAAAPLVAAFYRTPQLTAVTAVLSTSFVISGLAVQQDALLRRFMQFRSLAIVQVTSQVVTFITALLLAALDYGYWSLVGSYLAGAISATLVTVYLCPLVPHRPRRGLGIRDMLSFGWRVTGFDFVNYFARTADNIVVGRFLGGEALGFYSRAYNLFMLPITQIRAPLTQVALPALSALRADPDRYRSYYLRMVEAMAVLTVPIGVYCMLEGEFLVRVALGSQWSGAAATFRILAAAGILQASVSTVGLVMLSLGRADRQLRLGIANTVVVLTGILLGLSYGIEGVATGYVVANYLIFLPMLRYSLLETPLRVNDFIVTITPALVASTIAGILALISSWLLDSTSLLAGLSVLLVFAASYSILTVRRASVRSSLRLLIQSTQHQIPW